MYLHLLGPDSCIIVYDSDRFNMVGEYRMDNYSDREPLKPLGLVPWRKVLDFSLPAAPGCELQAVENIASFLGRYRLRPARLSRLKLAVREGALKMVEDASLSVAQQMINFQVLVSSAVHGLDPGSLDDKVDTIQVGWGFFMVQVMDGSSKGIPSAQESRANGHCLWLYIYIEGEQVEQ
jgi:hypothetical protein